MRHRRKQGKLGVKKNHRKALLRNLVRSLVIRKRIQTTFAKAKEASSFADKMVQIAKGGDLHARRLLISRLGAPELAETLLTHIAPRFKERQGGYTRVLRLGSRKGDGAETALLEFTELIEIPEKIKKPKKEKKPLPAGRQGKEVKEEKPAEKPKKEKLKEKEAELKKPEAGRAAAPEEEKAGKKPEKEKKETEKKGGFLSALRRFLKGDEPPSS